VANILKFPLKIILFLLYLVYFLVTVFYVMLIIPGFLITCVIFGIMFGPFFYLYRVFMQEAYLLFFVVFILFPLSILMGIKIFLMEYFM